MTRWAYKYRHQWTGYALLYKMALHMFCTKPLHKTNLAKYRTIIRRNHSERHVFIEQNPLYLLPEMLLISCHTENWIIKKNYHLNTWYLSQYKACLFMYRIPILQIRQLWDSLTFNMGIPILVRRYFYIENPLCSLTTLFQETILVQGK